MKFVFLFLIFVLLFLVMGCSSLSPQESESLVQKQPPPLNTTVPLEHEQWSYTHLESSDDDFKELENAVQYL